MEKKCKSCGHITKDGNALYCERCGKSFAQSNETPKGLVWNADAVYGTRNARIEREQARLFKAENRKKKLFALAFIGLLLDFIFGLGFILCLPVAIIASVDGKRVYENRKKMTTWHLWAIVVGYLGAVFGLAFFILIF